MMECNNNVSHSYYFYCICIIVVARVKIVSNSEKSTTCYFHSTYFFFQAIGRTFLPPYWSLGFQLSRWGYNKIETVKGLVANMSKHNLPQV